MYKCCWNCLVSCPAARNDKEEMLKLRASKRFCCASHPVSNRLENPFKQRYCKQFVPQYWFYLGHEITKKEAEQLCKMTAAELLEYWRKEEQSGDGNA